MESHPSRQLSHYHYQQQPPPTDLSQEDNLLKRFETNMDDFEKRQIEKIAKMRGASEIQAHPLFKAHRQEIYQKAYEMALGIKPQPKKVVKVVSQGPRESQGPLLAATGRVSIQREVQEEASQAPFASVTFQVHYITNFGQEVYLIGSVPGLGNWDAQTKAIKLTWSEGHLWRVTFPFETIFSEQSKSPLEYKFVIKRGPHLFERWEEGRNHIVNLSEVMQRVGSLTGQQLMDIDIPRAVGSNQDRCTAQLSTRNLQIQASWHVQ